MRDSSSVVLYGESLRLQAKTSDFISLYAVVSRCKPISSLFWEMATVEEMMMMMILPIWLVSGFLQKIFSQEYKMYTFRGCLKTLEMKKLNLVLFCMTIFHKNGPWNSGRQSGNKDAGGSLCVWQNVVNCPVSVQHNATLQTTFSHLMYSFMCSYPALDHLSTYRENTSWGNMIRAWLHEDLYS